MNRCAQRIRSGTLRAAQRGLTLIELMVAVLIAMVLTLAVFAVLSSAEGFKRSSTAVNDVNQSGNYAMYVVDKLVRGAGSGFSQSQAYAFGCQLFAARATTQVLPRAAALPAPFNTVNTGTANVFRLAPILIAPGQTSPGVSSSNGAVPAPTSDVLVVMASSSGFGETPTMLSGFASSSTLPLPNTVSFNGGDLVLVADQETTTGGVAPCMVQQVAAGFVGGTATSMTLGGTYYDDTIGTASLGAFTDRAVVMRLGSAVSMPTLQVIGVGDNNTLFSYDLLASPAAALPIAEGVFELHALYGVDSDNNGTVETWINPSTTTTYTLAALSAGTTAAADLLKSIKAIRVGLILRTALQERNVVAPTSVSLFSDLGAGLEYVRTLETAEQNFRYRTLESTIPLRNTMMLP